MNIVDNEDRPYIIFKEEDFASKEEYLRLAKHKFSDTMWYDEAQTKAVSVILRMDEMRLLRIENFKLKQKLKALLDS